MTPSATADLETFESHRALLVAHAYRMLGDLARAEDMVQEAWLRRDARQVVVDSPRGYLATLVTRLTPYKAKHGVCHRNEHPQSVCGVS